MNTSGVDTIIQKKGNTLRCKPSYPIEERLLEQLIPFCDEGGFEVFEVDLRECLSITSSELGVLALLKSEPFLEGLHSRLIIEEKQIKRLVGLVGLDSYYILADKPLHAADFSECPSFKCSLRMEKMELRYKNAEREKQQLERQIIHLQRTSEIGQLAAGVAHEFNNILMGMKGWSQLALDSREDDIIETALTTVNDLTDRAKRITGDLLSFSRKNEPVKIMADVNDILKHSIQFLSNQFILHSISCEAEYGAVQETAFDGPQLEQVFVNIMTNAMHAMKNTGGTLKVTTSCIHNTITIKIADTGTGISTKNLKKIFTPFFTTKGALGGGNSTGTGLGLAVSRGIILGHKGDIIVESSEGIGTTFYITIPVISGLQVDEPQQKTVPLSTGPRHVLVVDDELTLRRVLSKYLTAKGHTAHCVSNGEEAINYCRSNKPDIVLLDMLMPGINGADTYIELKRIHPDIKTAVITGHAGKTLDAMLNLMRRMGTIELITKPAKLTEILEFVERSSGDIS